MQRPVGVGDLGVLHMEARLRESVERAGMVEMQMRQDHVFELGGVEAEQL